MYINILYAALKFATLIKIIRIVVRSYDHTDTAVALTSLGEHRMENCDLVELAIEPHPTKLKPKFHPKKLKLVATILSFQPTPQQVFFFSPPIPLVLPPFFLTEKMKCLFNTEESGEIAVSNTRHQWPCIAADSASVYTAAGTSTFIVRLLALLFFIILILITYISFLPGILLCCPTTAHK